MAENRHASPRASGLSRTIIGALFALSIAHLAGDVGADNKKSGEAPKPAVSVADVSSAATSARLSNVAEIARKDLDAELSALDWSKARPKRRYSISVTVVELGSSPSGQHSMLSACVVSATVHEGDRGNILAILQGKARAEDSAADASATERAVLTAALRSAVAKVPDVIAATQ